jgi:hypothetical protein
MRSAWFAAPPSREHNLVARLNHCSQKGLGACPGLHLAVGGRSAAARCPSATERPGSEECVRILCVPGTLGQCRRHPRRGVYR